MVFLVHYRSDDGSTLVITSSDCYCTIVTFEPNELGAPLPSEKLPAGITAPNTCLLPSRPSPSPNSAKQPESDPHTDKDLQSDDVMIISPSPHSSGSADMSTSKPRRIRPTMVSTVTSPNGITASTPSPTTVPNQTLCSPSATSSQNASSTLSTQPTQSTTDSTATCQSPTASMDCSTQHDQTNGTLQTARSESPTSSSSGTESRPAPEKQGPRRVGFTTLSTFPALSSKTRAGSTSSEQEDCIVIE